MIYDGLRNAVPATYEERSALNNGALPGLNIQFNFAR
jgi:hypothetical protein